MDNLPTQRFIAAMDILFMQNYVKDKVEFCKKIGIELSTLNEIIEMKITISVDLLHKAINIFNLDSNFFFNESNKSLLKNTLDISGKSKQQIEFLLKRMEMEIHFEKREIAILDKTVKAQKLFIDSLKA